MEQLRPYMVSIAAVAVALIVVAVVYVGWISHEGSKLTAANATASSLQTNVNNLRLELNGRERDKTLQGTNCNDLQADLVKIPPAPQVAEFYHQVSAMASDADNAQAVSINVTQAPAPVSAPASASGSTSSGTLTPIEVQLTVNGNYGQLRSFLQVLDNSQRLFVVNSLNLEQASSTGNSGGSTGNTVLPAFVGGETIPSSASGYSLVLGGTIYYSPGQVNVCATTSTTH